MVRIRARQEPRPLADVPDLADLLRERGVRWVDEAAWRRLDDYETARGKAEGRPRVKLCSVEEMLEVAGAGT